MGETTNEVRAIGERKRAASLGDNGEGHSEGSAEATEIRAGIEETRSHLSSTIDALQDKLDPKRIAEQVKDQVREKATEAYDSAKSAVKEATIGKVGKIVSNVSEAVSDMTGQAGTAVSETSSSVMQYIRNNPVPFALVGIGLGMLAMNKRRTEIPAYHTGTIAGPPSERVQEQGSGVADAVQGAAASVADTARSAAIRATGVVTSTAGSVRDMANSAADTTRQQFHDVTHQAQQGARVAGDRLKGMLQDNPMTLGIAALAAGALAGLSLPSTEVEGAYMGESRDCLVDQAKSVAQEAAGKVGRIAGEAGHTLQDAAKREGLAGT